MVIFKRLFIHLICLGLLSTLMIACPSDNSESNNASANNSVPGEPTPDDPDPVIPSIGDGGPNSPNNAFIPSSHNAAGETFELSGQLKPIPMENTMESESFRLEPTN